MDRFIESLLLGYPVPGIFLIRQTDRRYLVLDGQQRLQTLRLFYEGVYAKKEFSLQNVSDDLKGLTYKSLDEEQRRLLDDSFIQATLVHSDGTDASLDSVYRIFERLNSGGTQLTPHEIRIALYPGPLVDLLAELNSNPAWRALYGRESPRLRDQELILRIVAFYEDRQSYRRPLKKFLNNFAQKHRRIEEADTRRIRMAFEEAVRLINDAVGPGAMRHQSSQLNLALSEAIVAGLMLRLSSDPPPNATGVAEAVRDIKQSESIEEALTRATADEDNVRLRFETAIEEFKKV